MNHMKYLVFLFLAFSCMPCPAQGKEKQKERTCRVIFLGRTSESPEKAYLFDGSISHEVALSDMDFSDVVKLPGGRLVLGMTPDPVAAPEEFPADAPVLTIPEGLTDFYLIVVSDPSNKVLPIRMQAVDAGTDLEPGQTLWINLTTHAIAGKLGNENLEIPAGGKIIGKAPLASSGYYRVIFAYQPESGGEFQPVMRKSWWFDATSKNLGFIVNSGGRLPKIFTFRDHRVPESREKSQ